MYGKSRLHRTTTKHIEHKHNSYDVMYSGPVTHIPVEVWTSVFATAVQTTDNIPDRLYAVFQSPHADPFVSRSQALHQPSEWCIWFAQMCRCVFAPTPAEASEIVHHSVDWMALSPDPSLTQGLSHLHGHNWSNLPNKIYGVVYVVLPILLRYSKAR